MTLHLRAMNHPHRHRSFVVGVGSCLLALLAGGAAEAMPWTKGTQQVTLAAREQPLDAFLENVFAQLDAPVSVSAGVRGQVNGRFALPAEQLLKSMAKAYNLVVFHDGLITHIASTREVQQRSFALSPMATQKLIRAADEMQLLDAHNTLRRAPDGSLQARGHGAFVEMVAELARAHDPNQPPAAGVTSAGTVAAPGREDFRVYYLRYAWAQDVSMSIAGRAVSVPGVANILRALVGAPPSSVPVAAREKPSNVQGLRGQGLAAQAQPSAAAGSSTLGLARTNNELLAAALQPQGAPPAAQPAPTAGPRIEADPRLNAVIVRDHPEKLDRYGALIAALDVEPQSLEIEATVIDINTDRLRELGINWRYAGKDGSELLFGNGTASDLALRANRDVTPSGLGGFLSAVLGNRNQFVARISALQGDGAAKIVSSPQVLTLSNVEAVFDSSSTFYVRVAGREQVDLFNITAGTSLRVMPHVFTDRDRTRIKLLVQVEDGSVTPRQVDQIPVVERATIQTQALIGEGESLLIGGIVRDSSSQGTTKVPLLGDVPILGHLFRTQTERGARVERMFLITPRLAPAGRPAATNVTPAVPATAPATPAEGAVGSALDKVLPRTPAAIERQAAAPAAAAEERKP